MKIATMAAPSQGSKLGSWAYESPALSPFDCLIKVKASGLCYSDVHMIDNDWNMSRYPLVPGHEVIGEVMERGDRVTHVDVGDRVGIGWQRAACLQCRDCLMGNENLCQHASPLIADAYGGFASHLVVDARFCFPIPTGLTTNTAGPLLCAGITVYAALRHAGMTSGQEIGVIGLGGLGHLAVQFARKLGNRVTVFTTTAEKVQDAERLGADTTVLIKEGKPGATLDRPIDILVNTVPRHFAWDSFLALLGSDGTLSFVGVPEEPISFSLMGLLFKRRRVMASPIGSRAMIQDMLDTAERYHVEPVVETFPLAEANEAIRRLRENRIRYRAVLIPGG